MDTNPHYSNLIHYLKAFAKLPEEFSEQLLQHAQYQKIEKGQVYLRKDSYDKKVGFLSNGIMRIYDMDLNGHHWNKALLTYQTILLGNPDFQQKSIHYIGSVTDCDIVEFPLSLLTSALEKFPEVRQVREKIIINIYGMKSERESDLLSLNAKDHYLKLQNRLGEKMDQIPQYHIASYLGITPIQLSRVKSSIAQ